VEESRLGRFKWIFKKKEKDHLGGESKGSDGSTKNNQVHQEDRWLDHVFWKA
jgi:hypothetical protein